jgi:hypothetical protein
MQQNIAQELDKLQWMRAHGIWPNGKRSLWAGLLTIFLLRITQQDAFGIVNLLSLYKDLDDKQFLEQAEQVVGNVYSVLGS